MSANVITAGSHPLDASGSRPVEDAAVRRALDVIHRHYAEPLQVERLARAAGVSRTILAERFVRAVGEPPMRYCGRWRLHVAAGMLATEKQSIAEVAFAVGFTSEAAFNRAFKRAYGQPPGRWADRHRPSSKPGRAGQAVLYCRARDGTRLAWSAAGRGPPLVKTANWLNHLEFDWESPLWRPWLEELTSTNQLIRYDERGNGMSDWDASDLSFEKLVDDLETVVDAAGVERFDLFAISQGAPVAVAYSLRHPGRIRRMVLLGGYSCGWRHRLSGDDLARREAMVTLTKTGWGSDNPAFRQMFTSLYIPDGSAEQAQWFNELQRVSASPENAVRLQHVLATIDVRPMLARVSVPTLVLHATNDNVVPISAGRVLADGIPGARFVELDSRNHVLLEHEPAWPHFLRLIREFYAGED
ncbi:alpha/beta fold hydrolase [Sphingomonas sabuli]|uniref:Alpha/beta fold hydrolase n=1 Tax=Sphingomonas sabuli TaxID=2764186 RepID=A0A7G9KZH1_9SPHN|nr:alpha/beta fold hydrolase [Sphingomonas sabuli]QNM81770.1 alpha/beta fold hydrolase [Sphingomonas sabuli]